MGEKEQLLHINVQRFRGGLVLKAHRLCVSLNSRLESNKEEEEKGEKEKSFYLGGPTHTCVTFLGVRVWGVWFRV